MPRRIILSIFSSGLNINDDMLPALAVLGIVGILGMTFLFPLAASMSRRSRTSRRSFRPAAVRSAAILIPAYCEGDLLSKTLSSVSRAVCLASERSEVDFKIIIGADGGLEERNRELAAEMNASVLESPERLGKWGMLCRLVETHKDYDWLIFADCGVRWEEDFLIRVLPYFRERGVIGVAPAYHNPDGGFLERITWWVERQIKYLESKSGGPVSVHGATVCYRRREAAAVFSRLSSRNWLNDDVVVPLCMRAMYPRRRIVYASEAAIHEFPKEKKLPSFNRRRRMVYGNLQWISALLIPLAKKSREAALLAMRRVFRVFWIYWLLFALAGCLMLIGGSAQLPLFLALALLLAAALSAARASLFAPFYMFSYFLLLQSDQEGLLPWN